MSRGAWSLSTVSEKNSDTRRPPNASGLCRSTARTPTRALASRALPHTHLPGSVAKSIWGKNGLHNGTIEATSREGCRLIKAASPQTKCFIYHNMELALESMESQRTVMYDASKADYFLQYTDGQGNKNGTIYNERQVPGDQFFWDFNNPAGQSNTRHWSASAASTARRHHRHPPPPQPLPTTLAA